MVWFIRRYQKGVKNSGTQDVLVSDDEISIGDFVSFAHQTGPGKYILGQRGKGIRGFRKITDCIIEEPKVSASWMATEDNRVFAAEEISVKKNIKLGDLSDSEIMDLMGSMADSDIKSAEEFSKFKTDLTSIHSEIARRGLGGETSSTEPPVVKQAQNTASPLASAGFAVGKGNMAVGFVGGMLVGVVGTMYYYKSKMDAINSQIGQIEKQLNEAESAIKRAESRETKRAEKDSQQQKPRQPQGRKQWDNWFLESFNSNNGPEY
ncbi:hypothetical protein N9M17_00185 [bacterium]|nr:hypothetical protein [bacterium]MDB4741163.1 hypothetical protein [Akkermansiaceae bacterium]